MTDSASKPGSSICYLCAGTAFNYREGTVRDRPELKVLECAGCGLVTLSSFDHIKSGFYEESGMHPTRVEPASLLRLAAHDDERRFGYLRRRMENQSLLDFGCGAAGFLIKAREIAGRACGVEIERNLEPHFRSEGLEVRRRLEDFTESFDLITLFHVLEHFPDPIELLAKLKGKLRPGGELVVEVPNANDALLALYRCRDFAAFTYWSCHLFLFNAATLATLAQRAGLHVKYLRHIQRYTPANHLHWLATGRPGGHQHWHFLDSPELTAAYEKTLAALGQTDTLLCALSSAPPS